MITAFIDMVGLLMIIPLLPFYVKDLSGSGLTVLAFPYRRRHHHRFIVTSYTVAQLLSAPLWGKFSDRVGRRPTLLIALAASGIAYLIFGFAHSLLLLFLSRLVQGAGGGTVGVIQAYVADSDRTERSHAGFGLVVGHDESGRRHRTGHRLVRRHLGHEQRAHWPVEESRSATPRLEFWPPRFA